MPVSEQFRKTIEVETRLNFYLITSTSLLEGDHLLFTIQLFIVYVLYFQQDSHTRLKVLICHMMKTQLCRWPKLPRDFPSKKYNNIIVLVVIDVHVPVLILLK